MKLSEIMTKHVETIRPDSTVREAAEKMKELEVGVLPVVDGERLVGLLTDRDITLRAVADEFSPGTLQVQSIMTASITYAYEDQTIEEAADLMKERQIRRLPVINHKSELVGIVSLGDIAVEREQLSGEILEEVSRPAEVHREEAPASKP